MGVVYQNKDDSKAVVSLESPLSHRWTQESCNLRAHLAGSFTVQDLSVSDEELFTPSDKQGRGL